MLRPWAPSADLHACRRFGDGTVRLTVEQDVLFPNIPEAKLEAFQADPLFTKFSLTPENLTRGAVPFLPCGYEFGVQGTKVRI